MVTSYLKEYVIRYYLDIINAQYLDQTYSSAKIDEFIFISRLQREISSIKAKGDTTNDYLWRCDLPSYDNSNGTLYYEMTHMMQTVIVKEENLDIHQSCSHNCDTWYIEDSMNYTECDGYYHCRSIDSSYEICEPVSSLIKNQTHWSPRTCSESRYSDEMEYELDLPIKSPQNSIDKYRGNVLFHYSGLTKDAGQSTVPFFDGQDVEGDPEFSLGEVGVIHCTRKGYGGFLAFRIYMPIFGQNFKNELYEE